MSKDESMSINIKRVSSMCTSRSVKRISSMRISTSIRRMNIGAGMKNKYCVNSVCWDTTDLSV